MKKILFTLMMLFTLSVNVIAENIYAAKKIESNHNIDFDKQVSKYDFTIDYRRIGCYLDMSIEQLDNFEIYYEKFKYNMLFVYYECDESSRDNVVRNAVNINIKEMHYILDEKQYKKYITLLNLTLINKGFNI